MELLVYNPVGNMIEDLMLQVLIWINGLLGGLDSLELLIETLQNVIRIMDSLT